MIRAAGRRPGDIQFFVDTHVGAAREHEQRSIEEHEPAEEHTERGSCDDRRQERHEESSEPGHGGQERAASEPGASPTRRRDREDVFCLVAHAYYTECRVSRM